MKNALTTLCLLFYFSIVFAQTSTQVHVDYTYMRQPYETFEPGGKQGSTYRDPRKIIGASVREIAQSIVGDKFIRVRRR